MDEVEHLYVTDLDGTLLNAEQELSLFGEEVITSFINSGGLFSFATARSLTSVQKYIDALNIRLPVVLYNGGFIYDPTRAEYLVQNYLPGELVPEVLTVLYGANLNPFVHAEKRPGEPRVYFRTVSNEGEKVYINGRLSRNDPRLRVTHNFAEAIETQVIEVAAIGSEEVIAACMPLIQNLPGIQCYFTEDVYCPGYFWLEVVHRQATKEQGVAFVKSYVGAEKLTCFGDNLNDLSMFGVADYAYAVANAHAEVKLAASGLIESNKDDGVARFLSTLTNAE